MGTNRVLLVLCLAVVGAGSVQGADPPTALSVEQLVQAYQSGCAALSSFDVYVAITTHLVHTLPPNDADYREATQEEQKAQLSSLSRQYLSGEKFRIDSLEHRGSRYLPGNNVSIWDGAVGKEYMAHGNEGGIGPRATPAPEDGCNLMSVYRNFMGNATYLDFLKTRSPKALRAKREGRLWVLTVANETGATIFPKWLMHFFLDPDKGCLPAKLEVFRADGTDLHILSRFENQLSEVQPSVWAPIRSRRTIFVTDTKSKYLGKEVSYQDLEVDTTRSRFNQDLDPALFTLEFPAGTWVHDRIRNTTYQVGSKDRASHLDELAMRGRLSAEELQRHSPSLHGATAVSMAPARKLLLGLNAAAVAAMLALVGYRAWKRRRAEPSFASHALGAGEVPSGQGGEADHSG